MVEVRKPELSSRTGRVLLFALWGVFGMHAVLLLTVPQVIVASRIGTALVPMLAGLAGIWRSSQVSRRERVSWRWVSSSLLLWSLAQLLEIYLSRTAAISSPVIDGSDLLYVAAAFPLLLAISNTRETENVTSTVALNLFQSLLAVVLTYVRLFRMGSGNSGTTIYWIYGAECLLLAVAGSLRLVSWLSLEERRRMRLVSHALWLYLPIEVGLDFASARWHLQKGTPLDLLWSVPFLYAGVRALEMPLGDGDERNRRRSRKIALLVQSVCPMLITCGVFALAASISDKHLAMALSAVVMLLLAQGLHAGAIQVKYQVGQDQLEQSREALRTANSGLERLSLMDPLTGIPNRRRFTEAYDTEWRRAMRKQESMAILMIDIDFFKSVNDLHGHAYGDRCLIQVAQAMRMSLKRGSDLVARYGGEEFIILLPDTGMLGASRLADRLLRAVLDLRLANEGSPFDALLTISIGIAVESPEAGSPEGSLIERADMALYRAKKEGRNRVCEGGAPMRVLRVPRNEPVTQG